MSQYDLGQAMAWFRADALVPLTWALVHFLWQGCAIAVVYLAIARALRRAPANARYIAGVAALLAMATCLPATLWLIPPPMELSTPTAAIATSSAVSPSLAAIDNPPACDAQQTPDEPATVVVRLAPSPVATTEAPSEPATLDYAEYAGVVLLKSSPYVAPIYLAGVLVMLLRVAVGLWSGRRLRGSCEPIADAKIIELLRRNAQRMGMRVVPAVAYCRRICVPVVVGVFRPMILLPASLASGLTFSQLEAVLLHELAHVRRFDLAVNVFQRLVEALLFFHPAVWWLSRRISFERENACDDAVLHLDHERIQYADALLRVAELCANGRLDRTALAATGDSASQFRRRVLRLLGAAEKPPVRLRSFGVLAAVLLIASLLLVPMLCRHTASAEAEPPEAIATCDKDALAATEVASPPAKDTLPVRVYRLNHARAEDVKKSLAPLLGPKGKLTVVSDAKGEMLVAIDEEQTLKAIDRVVAATDVKPAPAKTGLPAGTPSLSIHADDLDVRKVLEMASRETKVNILVSPNVTGRVTMDIQNKTFDETLEILARICDFVVRREGDIVFVSTPAEMRKAEEANLPIRVFHLNYVKSSDAMKMIKPLLSKVGTTTASPDSRVGMPSVGGGIEGNSMAGSELLVVQDYESVLKRVERVIAEIDVRPREVMIEAVLLRTKAGAVRAAMDDIRKTPAERRSPGIAGDSRDMNFGFIGEHSAAFIKALETRGEARMLAAPRLIVLNKQLAQIELGDPANLWAAAANGTDDISMKVGNAAEGRLKLAMRPFVSSDGMIRMEISLQRDAPKQNDKESPAAPVLPLATNVLVPDGQTFAIGFGAENPATGDKIAPPSASANNAARKELVLLVTVRLIKPTEIGDPAVRGHAAIESHVPATSESVSPMFRPTAGQSPQNDVMPTATTAPSEGLRGVALAVQV